MTTTTIDPDTQFIGDALAELGSRLVFIMSVKGLSVDDAEQRADQIAENAIQGLRENFELTDEQVEELEQYVNKAYNQRLQALIDMAKENA